MHWITKLLFTISFLTTISVKAEPQSLSEQQPYNSHLDPVTDTTNSELESHEHNKRTVLSHNNYAWAKHIKFDRHGQKYLLGYSPVDLKYVPVIKPLQFKPKLHWNPRPIFRPVVKPFKHNDWKPIFTQRPIKDKQHHPIHLLPHRDIIVPWHQPFHPVYSPPVAPTGISLPLLPSGHFQEPWYQLQLAKVNLGVLPLGSSFLSPVLPHQNLVNPVSVVPKLSGVISSPLISQNQHLVLQNPHLVAQNQHLVAQNQHLVTQEQHLAQHQHLVPQNQHLVPQNQHLVAQEQHDQHFPLHQHLVHQEQHLVPQNQHLVPQNQHLVPQTHFTQLEHPHYYNPGQEHLHLTPESQILHGNHAHLVQSPVLHQLSDYAQLEHPHTLAVPQNNNPVAQSIEFHGKHAHLVNVAPQYLHQQHYDQEVVPHSHLAPHTHLNHPGEVPQANLAPDNHLAPQTVNFVGSTIDYHGNLAHLVPQSHVIENPHGEVPHTHLTPQTVNSEVATIDYHGKHANLVPQTTPQQEYVYHQQQAQGEVSLSHQAHNNNPVATSIEFHGKHAHLVNLVPQTTRPNDYLQQQHSNQLNNNIVESNPQNYYNVNPNSIQPGQTDVQLPLHLPEHPNYQPASHLQYYNQQQRKDVDVDFDENNSSNSESNESIEDFKPSQQLSGPVL